MRSRQLTIHGALLVLIGALSGCTVFPRPLDAYQREHLAEDSKRALFENQEVSDRPLSLARAMARAIKYQAEYRQRRMEEAASTAQLDVARFDLLPKLTLNAGYTTRDNDSFGFGFTPGGTVAGNPSASSERSHYTTSVGFAWNILDFGLSYFRARELADQSLITQERRRKALQNLMHEVRIAWWRAEAAQRLLPQTDVLLAEVDRATQRTRVIEARKLLPPAQTATLRRALLDLSQQITFRRQELAQARVELAALVNLPPGSDFRVASPPSDERAVPDLTADLEKLETLALEQRPEIAEEAYRKRITRDQARKAIVGLLPAAGIDAAFNYDSNRFLLNNTWLSAGVSVAFNLVKVFSIPAIRRTAAPPARADAARRLAMAMAVLSQLHISAVRYDLVSDEFSIWDEAARDDDLIVKYLAASANVGIDTELELIRARARALASHLNRDLAYSNLQGYVARLYYSLGYDPISAADEAKDLPGLAEVVEARMSELERTSFTQRPEPRRPTLVLGEVAGAAPGVASRVREGAERVLKASGARFAGGEADARLQFTLSLEAAKEGRRAARLQVSLLPSAGAGAGHPERQADFRTMLIEPVDEEQWRVLGEGAAYRMLEYLSPLPERHRGLRTAAAGLETPAGPAPGAPPSSSAATDLTDLDGTEPLALRIEATLRSLRSVLSRLTPAHENQAP